MTPEQKAYYKQHLQYIRNIGGCVSVAIFDEDWDPVGPKLRASLSAEGLINVRGSSITLSDAGELAVADGA